MQGGILEVDADLGTLHDSNRNHNREASLKKFISNNDWRSLYSLDQLKENYVICVVGSKI